METDTRMPSSVLLREIRGQKTTALAMIPAPDQNPAEPDDASTGLPWPRTWRGVYLFVFGCFVLVVIALTLFARFFA
jgi:hypothetical protein